MEAVDNIKIRSNTRKNNFLFGVAKKTLVVSLRI